MNWTIATDRNGEAIWINLAQIRAMVRENGETQLHFADGICFPVREAPADLLRTPSAKLPPSALRNAITYNS